MISKQLLRALAVMGIQLVHSKPGEPAGRGKIERVFRTVRDQFLVELSTPQALADVKDLVGLNELFTAWVETVYHHNVHSETGQEPLARFLASGPPELPDPQLLFEAFQWSHERLVTNPPPPLRGVPPSRRSTCSVTFTRSMPPWWGAKWNWFSTHST